MVLVGGSIFWAAPSPFPSCSLVSPGPTLPCCLYFSCECVEDPFCELRLYRVLVRRSSHRPRCVIRPMGHVVLGVILTSRWVTKRGRSTRQVGRSIYR